MATHDDVLISAMNCPPAWAGEHLDTYAYMLAGALSTIMMPPDMVMPSEQITGAIERLNALGPGPWRSEDDL